MTSDNHLELFSGTHSFGKVSSSMGFNVYSLDRDLGAECPFGSGYVSKNHIQADIMTWDYKQFKPGFFKIITASPSCFYWSPMRKTNYGKELKAHPGKIFCKEILLQDIEDYGKPMVDKVFEIFDYFQPEYWLLENPKLGSMKDYINDLIPCIDVDYCRYGFNYKKPTRIWTNIKFDGLICNHKKHQESCCGGKGNNKGRGGGSNRLPRYVIPPKLIEDIFLKCSH